MFAQVLSSTMTAILTAMTPLWTLEQVERAVLIENWREPVFLRARFHNSSLPLWTLATSIHHWTLVNKVTFVTTMVAAVLTVSLSSHRFIGTQKLSEMLQQPYDLFKPGWADHYVLGMVNQVGTWRLENWKLRIKWRRYTLPWVSTYTDVQCMGIQILWANLFTVRSFQQ